MDEHAHAVALMKWARLAQKRWPALRWLYAVPNGGDRHLVTAARLKAEGVARGVPDYCLPVPVASEAGVYHGMYLELKRETSKGKRKGRVSAAQTEWIEGLRTLGYHVTVAWGWQQAASQITHYLEGLE